MRMLIRSSAFVSLVLFVLVGCTDLNNGLKNSVTFHYDHVANAQQIRFSSPVTLSPPFFPINFVTPVDPQGFWAVFVLCNLEVSGSAVSTFNYDVNNFRVEYGSDTFGPLQPFTLRLQSSADLNNVADTPKIAQAIMKEIDVGPPTQAFPHALYPSLNYRLAIYIPKPLPGYAGEQLTLRYIGQPSIVLGGGQSPMNFPVLGGGAASAPGACRS